MVEAAAPEPATARTTISKGAAERTIDLVERLDLSFDKVELPPSERSEPMLIRSRVPAAGSGPPRLDPARTHLASRPPSSKRRDWRGPTGSLLLHLLPLLALIAWTQRALDVPRPIPIQLVIEQPPPPPPPPPPAPPKPETAPPPGRLASDDFGAVGSAHKPKSAEAETPSHEESAPPVAEKKPTPAASEPPAPAETTQTATLVPPPPEPPPSTVPETPPLDPLLEQGLPVAMPPPAAPPPKQMAPKRPAAPPSRENLTLPLPFSADSSGGAASARYPGPSATRDQYCAYALFLIMQHIDLLPRSLLGARRGYVTVTIQLRPDGTIVRAMAARGSGYLDIDERVVAMVKAVGRFPPLPLWVSTPVADFAFHMHFPDQSEH